MPVVPKKFVPLRVTTETLRVALLFWVSAKVSVLSICTGAVFASASARLDISWKLLASMTLT